jgi:asparagine synthase (glutamine-hydrolysing)
LAAFSKSFKIKSHLIPMLPEEDFPLAPIVQNSTWHPFESSYELYASSVTKQADYLHRKGATVLFQGTGGDELFENIPDLNAEKPLGAYFSRTNMVPDYMQPRFGDFITNAVTQHHQQVCPIPLLSNSVATTGNTTNTILLERGIWPVMPLADARLYVYCQHLPIEYRMKRNLMRAYLLARGHPVQTHTPQRNEDFGQFFKDAAPKGLAPIFSTLLQDSVLGNAGLVDMDAADREWQLAASRGAETVSTPIFTLYCLLIAEINARFLDTTDLY